ncbi:MAG: ABC transporter permease [Spirochaetes bacterium]|nr:ABC transporter permease [Spirochaetota bacterium]
MRRLAGIIRKETLEILRDLQSLFLLIVMPAVFILVMSLSMQALFQPESTFTIKIVVLDHDGSVESRRFTDLLKMTKNLSITEAGPGITTETFPSLVTEGESNFGLVINRGFSAFIRDIRKRPAAPPLSIYADPTIQTAVQVGVRNQLVMQLFTMRMNDFFDAHNALLGYAGFSKENFTPVIEAMADIRYVYRDRQESVMPSAAQQSVPAWLVFSMYFIVIPISLIFHTEKNNGTLQRLRSINISSAYLVSGKIVAYYLVSMVQVVTMLCVGRYLVPLLGGDTIRFGDSPMGLFAIATCVGLNAISYGLMISALSKNTQVAGSLGVILVIIFAAIGGIMVPKFVMPAFMQNLSAASPLSWGLEGFLDIMLRNGTLRDILPACALLLGTGAAMLAATGILIKKKNI